MVSFGLFGSAAPRIRRLQPQQIDMLSYAPQMPQATPVEQRRPKFTAQSMMNEPAPAPAPAEAASGQSPPLGMFGSSAPKPGKYQNAGDYQPGKRDWMKEIGSDPLGFFLTGTDGLSQQRDEAMSYAAQQAAAEERARKEAQLMDQARAAGIDPGGILAMSLNPTEFGKSYGTNYEAANIAAGDSRVVRGAGGARELITAPKFGVDGGYGYSQTPEGIEWQEQRGRNYAEDTDAATLDETKRNNDMANSRGWGQIGVDRDRLAFEKTKADNENGGLGKLTPMQQAVDKNWADDLVSWETNGRADFVNNMALLNGAIGKINEGKELSGSGSNFLGGWGRDVWGAEGWAVQKDIEQVVQRNLKAVLGAQFTQSEGDRLIQRAYDPTAEESVNLRRLQMLQRQMEIAAEQRSRASEYFNKNGTMVGFQGAMPTVQDFENAIDSAITDGPMQMRTDRGTETIPAQSWSAAPGGSARSSPTTPTAPMDWRAGPSPQARPVQQQRNALPPGVTPEMWAVMDDEDKAAFQQ